MYGLSGKEIWLTETGTYSGTSTGPDGQPWPDQSSEYQASWWVKQSTYCLANGISKFFWVFYYSDQSDWRSTVAFVDIDRTTKKAVYYTHKLLAEKLDAFSISIQNSYSASAQNQTAGNFRFTVNGKPVYVIWNDAGGSETLTGFTSTRVKVTKAVPVLDSNGSVVLDAYGNPTFETSIVNVLNGQISLTLSSVPIYIEEIENAPATPTLISPADGAMGVSTSLSLVWNRSSGAMNYRVQLSTTPNFLSIIDDSTLTDTFKQVGPLQNGTTYYWRVSATNTGGTSNWSSTWSFTTIVAAPMAPSLVSPLNGSTGVDTNPILTWNSSTGATSYRLQISTNSSFTSLVYDQSDITDTTHQVTGLANNTLYYWRVNATNAGGTSSYSAIWSFTTIVAAPMAPSLVSPLNGSTGVDINPTLTWNSSTGATSYRLQVSTNSSFTSLVYDQNGITDTTHQVTGLANNTLYYWRVNATNAGGTSSYSAIWSFTTIIAAPMAPSLVSPLNGSTGVDINPTLTWNSSTGATSYRLQVSTNSSFTSLVYDQNGITDTTHQVTGLANNTLYYWRVNATNAGGTSSYSAIWSFTTIIAAPMAPSLVSPLNGSTGVDINPTLTWNSSTGATSYRLQVSTNSSFTLLVYDQSGITDTTHQVTGLANNTLYYWRVNATNAGGTSSYSAIWSFTTIGPMSVEQIGSDIPTTYALYQNYPNPFNLGTTIQFSIAEHGNVSLVIFNSLGMKIAILFDDYLPAGYYRIHWVASGISSGVYFYQLRTSGFTQTKKLLLLR
ncbi:T9SS type A sorting domain-containing protein [Rosettibacter firmus]|uniref:T9SS type A sorting domain-containing protein n=1 Tax=Rosettibacter firmus TaxID=3111522 RepID=UPI003EC0BB2B